MWEKVFGKPTDEDYISSAHVWFHITLIAAGLTLLFILFSGAAVLAQTSVNAAHKASQAFAPFFVGAMATVTFCGAIWRGKLGAEQTKQQKRQNDAKVEENLAGLLVEGTKLLGEKIDSHKYAGIAALQAVACSKDSNFAVPAMDILVDVISENYANAKKRVLYMTSRKAVRAAHIAGSKSTRSVVIDMTLLNTRAFPRIEGVAELKFIGGTMSAIVYSRFREMPEVEFEGTTVVGAKVGKEARYFEGCTFNGCEIKWIDRSFIASNTFNRCNFSEAETSKFLKAKDIASVAETLLSAANYYHPGALPQSQADIAWSDALVCKPKRTRIGSTATEGSATPIDGSFAPGLTGNQVTDS